MVDALQTIVHRLADGMAGADVPPKRAPPSVLVTLHRRETQGTQQRRLCRMLARVASRGDVRWSSRSTSAPPSGKASRRS